MDLALCSRPHSIKLKRTLYAFRAGELHHEGVGSGFSVPFRKRFLAGSAGKHRLSSRHRKAERTLKHTQQPLYFQPFLVCAWQEWVSPLLTGELPCQTARVRGHLLSFSAINWKFAKGCWQHLFLSSLLLKMSEMDHHKASWYMKGGTVANNVTKCWFCSSRGFVQICLSSPFKLYCWKKVGGEIAVSICNLLLKVVKKESFEKTIYFIIFFSTVLA